MREAAPKSDRLAVRMQKINQTNPEFAPLFGTSVAFESQAYRSAKDAVSSGGHAG